ncbi:Tetratricopeptide (TPR) repeat [Amycolatopsis xylanica]|uniref:Tetratricopeptide (TPR) repeat n=1 Tax=Amycolatopsis xylanica TaxID=589385 RepID=A0A1H2W712_9PSEU|nr:tetratricopeptide repeat protein [Amycolatopsis xylanica]SDW76328.1 Tetratricopeptide (TPR) repeat [Amycolatopsis xylanica]
MRTHHWVAGARRRDRERTIAGLALPPVLASIDAHRRLRGPYTAAGTLVRQIAGDLLTRLPELGPRHNTELLSAAPELIDTIPTAWVGLEWTVGEGERTRYFSRLHTVNVANGFAEILRDYLAALDDGPRTLIVDNAHLADPSDQELLAVLLRRRDLPLLTLVVGTGTGPLADPPGETPVSLRGSLAAHARRVEAVKSDDAAAVTEDEVAALAKSYVDGDGVSDDPRLREAYLRLPAPQRAALHDDRARVLAERDEFSLRLGAIPYHAEHGTDPRGLGVRAVRLAMEHCRNIGLYHASADLALRGRALVGKETDPELWWRFGEEAAVSMASLGRAAESEAILHEARAATSDPGVHMNVSYTLSMLYARHYSDGERDFDKARAWINQTIAIATLLEEPKKRVFQSVFSRNGLALIEVRQKRPEEALRLLEDGMAELERDLGPDEQALHRSVLRYNRGQVLAMMGRLEEALADYQAVIEVDPEFSEHHFNVGNLLRQLGRHTEALRAYEHALSLDPPFPECYYNLADTRRELGDDEQALADFGYVIELDPAHVDARINRAGMLRDRDDLAGAWEDVTAGLELAPRNPHLLCLKGSLLAEQGDARAAIEALTAALEADPKLAEAWALRGGLAYDAGRTGDAVADLDHAVALADQPAFRYNRGVIHQERGSLAEAIADYQAVLTATDDEDARDRLDSCQRAYSARVGV